MTKRFRFASFLTIIFGLASHALAADDFADNWHRWRGPHADGSSTTADPPVEWSATKNIKWKAAIAGHGSSTPIVWGKQIILLTAIKTQRTRSGTSQADAPERPADQERDPQDTPPAPDTQRGRGRFGGFGGLAPTNFYQFVVASYDRDDGNLLWQTVVAEKVPHEAGHSDNTFASSSPVTDGERIFVSFGSRGVYCLDMNGKTQWNRDLGRMQTRSNFGEASSPALHQDTLLVPWDHEGQSFLYALDATTGDVKWKVPRDERTTWATPLVTEFGGRTQVVLNGSLVRSYDLASGELIWECGGQVFNPIPSPVREGDTVICMTGYRGNAIYAIPLNASGDISDSDQIAWYRNDAAPYVSSPVLYKGTLYFTKSRGGVVSSVDAKTGEVVIGQQRLSDIRTSYASPVAAADRIYFTGRDGTTVVIEHGPELKVIAVNKLDEGIDASPAILGNEMYLRGESHLYCVTRSSPEP